MSLRRLRGGTSARGDSPEGPHERTHTGFPERGDMRQAYDVVTSVPAVHDVGLGKNSDTHSRQDLPPGYGALVSTSLHTSSEHEPMHELLEDPQAELDPARAKKR